MSASLESVVSSLETVGEYIRRADLFWSDGVKLLGENKKFVADLYQVMAGVWQDVSHSPDLLNRRWAAALCAVPTLTLVGALKDIDFQLISESHSSYASFKHWRRATYPTLGHVLSPLNGALEYFFEHCSNLYQLRTALRFITRANLPVSIGLEDQAFGTWYDRATRDWCATDTCAERKELEYLFPRYYGAYRVKEFTGHFGPGASAGIGRSKVKKYKSFCSDSLLDYIGLKCGFRPQEMPCWHAANASEVRTSKLSFAPKWLDVMRTISVEPAQLMFYQLGFADYIYDVISRSPWARHVSVREADRNTDLAECGALSGEFSTIDLSNASDGISLKLVRQLFDGTALREALIGCRSRWVEYKGEIYTPTYYAPMGSGLCFPVECLTFASVVSAIMRRHRDRRAWRVYGDDIVVPTDRYDEVLSRLVELGFEPNFDKSFGDPHKGFRESCGGDFFYGYSVRPVYISRFWTGFPRQSRNVSVAAMEGTVDMANRLKPFPHARVLVVRRLLRVNPRVLFDLDGTQGIASVQPTNYHLDSRWNADLQRIEYLRGQAVQRKTDPVLEDEAIRLFEWLRAAGTNGERDEPFVADIAPATRAQWRARWGTVAPGWFEDF